MVFTASAGSIVAAGISEADVMSGPELRFLGEFKVIRDGQATILPPSRKTRALLACLSLNRRRFRREQLFDLLWEVPTIADSRSIRNVR